MRKILILLSLLALASCSTFENLSYLEKVEAMEVGADILGLESDLILEEIELMPNYQGTVGGFGEGTFKIKIIPETTNSKAFEIIAHELIHVEQLESGRLKSLTHNTAYYNGKIYVNWQAIKYIRRPWEQEAFNRSKGLLRDIKKRLNK